MKFQKEIKLEKFLEKIKDNKEYLLGLFFVLITMGVFLLLFFNKSISMQEGWYHIYIKRLFAGLIPYKDFPIVVTPFALFSDALFYKIFGGAFIVSHYVGVIDRLVILGLLYHLFSRFFSKAHSAYATIIGGIIVTTVVLDNAVYTYNEFAILIGLITTNLLISFTENIEKDNKIDYKRLILIGLVQGLAFINKQTFGIITTFVTGVLLLIIIQKKFGFKNVLKPILVSFVNFLIVVAIPLLYLFYNGALFAFVDNTMLTGASAKGNLKDLLIFYFKFLGSPDYMWGILIFTFAAIFLYFLSQKKVLKEEKYNSLKFFSLSIFLSLLTIFSAYCFVKFSPKYVSDLSFVGQVNHAFIQLSSIGVLFTTLIAFWYFCKVISDSKFNIENIKKLILYGMIFTLAYSISLSGSLPNQYFYSVALFFALILNYKTIFNNQKNIVIYAAIFTILFFGVSLKLITPCYWHCWINGDITGQMATPKIKILKGLKLTVEETNVINEIKTQVDKYTKKDDKILVYNNIQAFYEILERQPYTKNVSHFWDVCPDKYAEEDAKIILKSPPPVIIYLQMPIFIVTMHERLFRGGVFAGQRKIDEAILKMENNGTYVLTKKYTGYKIHYEDYIKDKKLLKKYKDAKQKVVELGIKDATNYIDKNLDMSLYYKKSALENFVSGIEEDITRKNKLGSKRTFLPDQYELKVLIRKDLYDENN